MPFSLTDSGVLFMQRLMETQMFSNYSFSESLAEGGGDGISCDDEGGECNREQ